MTQVKISAGYSCQVCATSSDRRSGRVWSVNARWWGNQASPPSRHRHTHTKSLAGADPAAGGEPRELPLEDGLSDSGDGPGVVGTCQSTRQTGSPQGSGRELCACARAHTHTHKHVALPNLSLYFESPSSRKPIAKVNGSLWTQSLPRPHRLTAPSRDLTPTTWKFPTEEPSKPRAGAPGRGCPAHPRRFGGSPASSEPRRRARASLPSQP